jgi:hypothetical protein
MALHLTFTKEKQDLPENVSCYIVNEDMVEARKLWKRLRIV